MIADLRRTFLLICLLWCPHSAIADVAWKDIAPGLLERALNLNPFLLLELDRPVIKDFYRARDFRPLWVVEHGRLLKADELIDAIRHADEEGLDHTEYFLDDISKYSDGTDSTDAVNLELWLTAALYRYAHDRYSGRLEPWVADPDWHIPNSVLDTARLFEDVAGSDSIVGVLASLSPLQHPYRRLRAQLQRYRDIADLGGWGKWWTPLDVGIRHTSVRRLRQRLQLEGDLAAGEGEEDIFDTALADAVQRYQRRHGIEPSGRLDDRTMRSLNVSVEDRIALIRVNMERWRWLPRNLGRRYLAVNMTGFELAIIDEGEVELTMPVIIGKQYRETPALSGTISFYEYNPYWTITKRVMWEKFIPGQIKDPGYLAKRSIRVFRGWQNPVEVDPQTVDWTALDPRNNSPYWMRQDPGPGNALGNMKFIFSNPYHIYLHGTPEKHLFDRAVRTYSHGCIRVKDPARLAVALRDGDSELMTEVQSKISSGANERVYLPRSVPVYLMYWTAWVDEDGVLNFRDDIYGRDTLLRQRLEG